jgi:predicted TIM-barrel fold metal-dependent hydrolase
VGLEAAGAVVSADSHVTEPADLWCARLDRAYRDRAPRVVRDFAADRYLFVGPGIRPFAVATGFGAGKHGEDLKRHLRCGYEAARPGGWDPAERLRDQDADGVGCEVLYPTHALKLFALPDADLRGACFRTYNDWVAEYAAHAPRRLVALAAIALDDAGAAVRELERAVARGARGVLVAASPPDDAPPYGDPAYDPFWAAAQAHGVPVSLHCISSASPRSARASRAASPFVQYLDAIHDVQRSLAEIVCGGVLERFPSLAVVSAENDCGWFAHFLYRLDHAYERFGRYAKDSLPLPPSSYVHRQVFATFQDDPTGLGCDAFAENNFLWASDYPHADSTWPNSRETIARTFAGLPRRVVEKVTRANAERLYRIGA